MKKTNRPVILFLLALYVGAIQSLQAAVRFERLTITDGLSQVSVEAIFQDSDGFMWFGTHDGLNRYDGYQFKQFHHDTQNVDTLSSGLISVIYEDQLNTLWIGTEAGGLNRYNRQTKRFTRFRYDAANPDSLSHDNVRAIHQDSNGILWIATLGGGLNKFDADTEQFVHFRHQPSNARSLSHDNVRAIYSDSKGTLWVGTDGGLNRYDPHTRGFDRFTHQPQNPNSLSHNSVYSIVEDNKGLLWLGTYGGGLNRYDDKTQSFVAFKHQADNPDSLSSNKIWTLMEDKAHTLWIGTDGGGLAQLDAKREKFVHHNYQSADPHSLSNNSIRSIYQSNKGFVWVGTMAGGLNKIDSKQQQFGHIKHRASDAASLSQDIVVSLLEDPQGVLWVGTFDGGLNRSLGPGKGFKRFKHAANDPGSISDNSVWAIHKDSSDTLWVGTDSGLNKYDPNSDGFLHFRHDPADPTSLSHDWVEDILQDSQGTLWIGTRGGGLNRFDPKQQRFSHFRSNPADPTSLSGDIIIIMFEDNTGELWIGTWGSGLSRFDPTTERFVRYRHDNNDPTSLSHDIVMSIEQDSQGNLWIGTFGGGLNKYDRQSDSFTRYQEQHGLANNTLYGILDDLQGNLWLSSNRGLSKFNIDNESFKHYDISDGLQNNEFNSAFFRSPSGELFFGGINGFNRFYPDTIRDDQQPPTLVFTEFLMFNQPVPVGPADPDALFTLPSSIEQLKTLTLDHRHALVSFEFAALDHRSPMKNQYAYQLEGLDKDWIKADAKIRRATYTNLPAGNYTLRVKAANSDGYWNEQGISLKIRVNPPWWQSWQAYLLYFITAIALIYAAYHYRTRGLVRRANELEQGVARRTVTINRLMSQKERMFANVSHEFKTPITLILNPLESLSLHLNASDFGRKVAMMKRNGQRLLRMVDQLLELSKLETTQMEQRRNYSLNETLKLLLNAFTPLLDSKNITLSFGSGSHKAKDAVLFLTADSLEMILNNLISNAIKYTPEGGQITVTTEVDEKQVVVAVKDSGIGISEQNQQIVFNRFTRANETHDENIPGAGIGLALVKELVDVNRGSIGLTSQIGSGSTFTLTLPLAESQSEVVEKTTELSTTTLFEIDSGHQSDNPMPPSDKAQSSQPILLLIDDNADMLTLLTDTLNHKYHCITAHDGEQGLAFAKAQLPDLVISDVMMPGISGFEVLRQLKQDQLTNHIPVILLTAKSGVKSRIKGWTENADEYLEKPFHGEELQFRIESLLSVRSLLRHRYQREFAAGQSQPTATVEAAAQENPLDSANQTFFDRIDGILEQHYADQALDVSFLAEQLGMSKRQLTRKMKSLLDFTPGEFIRSFRLNKAAQQLRNGDLPGSVYHQVGFTSHSYFSQCFKAQHGCTPASYNESCGV